MQIKTLIVGYKPLMEDGEKHKPSEIRADNYFKNLLKKFNLGEISFTGYNDYKSSIDQLDPILCIVLGDYTAEQIKAYKKDILLYVTYSPAEIFHRKKEQEKRKKEQEKTFKEIEGLIQMIQEKGKDGLSSARAFAAMNYEEMYKLIKQCITSDKPNLQKQAWDLINRNDVHSQFIWMRANLIADCWKVADAKSKEEFLTLAMKQYIDEGYARQLDNFTDQDGIEYKQYMFLSPNSKDLNYIRRIPIATKDMDTWAYESLLDQYDTPKSAGMLVEVGKAKKIFKEHKTKETK